MKRSRILPALALALMLLGGCGSRQSADAPAGAPADPAPSAPAQPLPPVTATLAVCGDAMSHMPQTRDAYDSASGAYNYVPMIEAVAPWLAQADYGVVNLETVLGGGDQYSGFPTFNSPDALAEALREVGFDLIGTANNHSLDQRHAGLSRTLDVLDGLGLAHTGTYRSAEERAHQDGVTIADVGGIRIAFLAYTYGTNGIPVQKDHPDTINLFTTDYMEGGAVLDEARLAADLETAHALEPDLIAVLMHWGVEYQRAPSPAQQQAADFLFAHGVDLILGSHPHVLQPMETRTVTGPDGVPHTGFVCWSLGNFISSQNDPYTDTTVLLNLELTRDPNTDVTEVTGVSYVPLYMLDREQEIGGERFTLLDVHAEIAAYEAGAPDAVSASVYEKLLACAADCRELLGSEWEAKAPAA